MARLTDQEIKVRVTPDGPRTLLAFAVAGLVLGTGFALGVAGVAWMWGVCGG